MAKATTNRHRPILASAMESLVELLIIVLFLLGLAAGLLGYK